MPSQPVRVAIDLETTGLVAEQDSIIEVGAIKFAGDEVLETFESFVAARQPLPYRVQRLTGIRPSDLAGAPAFAELAPRLQAFLGDHPLVGHSVQFDAAFLRRVGLARRNPLLDTYELASALLPDLASYTLEGVGVALGVQSPIYHRALADAVLARDVFLALLERLHALDPATLRALSRLSAGNDWTPAYLVRTTMREQGIAPATGQAGTLGGQLTTKLGLDPAVLSLAVARENVETVTLPALHPPAPVAATDEAAEALVASGGSAVSADADGAASANPAEAQRTSVSVQSPAADRVAGLQAIATLVAERMERGGTALIEADGNAETIETCLEPLLARCAAGARAMVVVADAPAAARVVHTHIPRALARCGLAPEALPLATIYEPASYLCLHRWFGAATQPRDSALPRDLARGLAKIAVWSHETRTGARAEVSLSGQEQMAWERTRAGREFVDSRGDCAYLRHGYCFIERARETARAARVVVTTHAAMAERLAGREHLLADADRVLVLDAQGLEDELRRATSWSVDLAALASLLADLAQAGANGARSGLLHLVAKRQSDAPETTWAATIARAQKTATAYFAALGRLHAEAQTGTSRGSRRGEAQDQALRLDGRARRLASWPEVEAAWAALRPRLDAVAKLAGDVAVRATGQAGQRASMAADGVATDLMGARRTVEEMVGRLSLAFEPERTGTVFWLRQSPSIPSQRSAPARGPRKAQEPSATTEPPTLYAGRVEVGALLTPLTAAGHGLVLVGTALAAGGEFEFTSGTLGLAGAEARTLAVSPDRSAQTLLLLPDDVPEPNTPAYQRQLDEALTALGATLGGRMVAIFPSHAALRAAYAGIKQALEKDDVLVLAQGLDGSLRQLWQTFHGQPRVVLLGAGQFWGGAELEGPAPTCVVVARLPFPSLSDPLLAARAETWHDPQAQFVVPHAALRVRQALSGLVWSHCQRNAVVLFDRRVQSRGYGSSVLATLPRCTVRHEPTAHLAEQVAGWVNGA